MCVISVYNVLVGGYIVGGGGAAVCVVYLLQTASDDLHFVSF